MMNYREKNGKDPQPSERKGVKLLEEATAVIDKYNLGERINHLIE